MFVCVCVRSERCVQNYLDSGASGGVTIAWSAEAAVSLTDLSRSNEILRKLPEHRDAGLQSRLSDPRTKVHAPA